MSESDLFENMKKKVTNYKKKKEESMCAHTENAWTKKPTKEEWNKGKFRMVLLLSTGQFNNLFFFLAFLFLVACITICRPNWNLFVLEVFDRHICTKFKYSSIYIYLKDSSTVLLNPQYIPHTHSPNKERTPHRLTHTHIPPQPRGMHASWK